MAAAFSLHVFCYIAEGQIFFHDGLPDGFYLMGKPHFQVLTSLWDRDMICPIYKKEAKAMASARNNMFCLYASAYYYFGGLWSPCAKCLI
jgi:hypothetical protein